MISKCFNHDVALGMLLLFSQTLRIDSFTSIPSKLVPILTSSHNRCLLFSSATANGNKSGAKSPPKKIPNKARKNAVPNARYLAVAALSSGPRTGDTIDSTAFASRRLDTDFRYKQLEPRDRAFARLLVATVERRLGQIDKILSHCIDKYPPKGKHANVVQATLRIGVAQLLFLNTPPHAATSDTVEVLRMHHQQVKKKCFPVPDSMIRFVNGVLRKLSKPSSEEEIGTPQTYLYGHLLLKNTSVNDNIAPWLLQQWEEDWGESRAKLIRDEMMPSTFDQTTSRIDVTTKYSVGTIVDVESNSRALLDEIKSDFGEDCVLLPHGSLRVGSSLGGDVSLWPGYTDGTWWVQDASSTLPALVLTQALWKNHGSNLSGLRVVDMCSAPGGKACQLLSAGFEHVVAIEGSERRSKRLVENLARLNLSERCEVVIGQGQEYHPSEKQQIDGILLDVPCSATGTGSRRPDVLRRSPDLSELLNIQELLVNHCADNVLHSGGILVYATCSILKEESEHQVTKLIERSNGDDANCASVRTLPIQPHEVPGFEDAIDENGWLRVLPGVLDGELHSTDGFFVARLIKN